VRAFPAMRSPSLLPCAWTIVFATSCASAPPTYATRTELDAATTPDAAAPPAQREDGNQRPAHGHRSARAPALVLGGLGVAAGLAAIGFAIAGAAQNTSIKNGGFATATSISGAEIAGERDNEVAYGAGALSIALLTVGAALYLYSLPAEPHSSQSAAAPALFKF
jgi:hypothetical protein